MKIVDVDKRSSMLKLEWILLLLIQKLVELREETDYSGLVTTTPFNTKVGEVEKKISDVSCLVKKTIYNAKISDIHTIYFSLQVNKVTIKLLNSIMLIKLQCVNKEYFMMNVLNLLSHLIIDFKLTLNHNKVLVGVV